MICWALPRCFMDGSFTMWPVLHHQSHSRSLREGGGSRWRSPQSADSVVHLGRPVNAKAPECLAGKAD